MRGEVERVMMLMVRLDHLVRTRIPGERWLLTEATRYHAMAGEMTKAMDGLPRDRLVNTTLERMVARHSSDAVAILAEATP